MQISFSQFRESLQKYISQINLLFLSVGNLPSFLVHLTIKTPSCQYRNPHHKVKTVSWPSYLYHGNLHTWKDNLYIETGPRLFLGLPISVYTAYMDYMDHAVHCLKRLLNLLNPPFSDWSVLFQWLIGPVSVIDWSNFNDWLAMFQWLIGPVSVIDWPCFSDWLAQFQSCFSDWLAQFQSCFSDWLAQFQSYFNDWLALFQSCFSDWLALFQSCFSDWLAQFQSCFSDWLALFSVISCSCCCCASSLQFVHSV